MNMLTSLKALLFTTPAGKGVKTDVTAPGGAGDFAQMLSAVAAPVVADAAVPPVDMRTVKTAAVADGLPDEAQAAPVAALLWTPSIPSMPVVGHLPLAILTDPVIGSPAGESGDDIVHPAAHAVPDGPVATQASAIAASPVTQAPVKGMASPDTMLPLPPQEEGAVISASPPATAEVVGETDAKVQIIAPVTDRKQAARAAGHPPHPAGLGQSTAIMPAATSSMETIDAEGADIQPDENEDGDPVVRDVTPDVAQPTSQIMAPPPPGISPAPAILPEQSRPASDHEPSDSRAPAIIAAAASTAVETKAAPVMAPPSPGISPASAILPEQSRPASDHEPSDSRAPAIIAAAAPTAVEAKAAPVMAPPSPGTSPASGILPEQTGPAFDHEPSDLRAPAIIAAAAPAAVEAKATPTALPPVTFGEMSMAAGELPSEQRERPHAVASSSAKIVAEDAPRPDASIPVAPVDVVGQPVPAPMADALPAAAPVAAPVAPPAAPAIGAPIDPSASTDAALMPPQAPDMPQQATSAVVVTSPRAEAVSLLQLVRDHMNLRAPREIDAAASSPSHVRDIAADASVAAIPVAVNDTAPPLAPSVQTLAPSLTISVAATPAVDLSASLGAQVVDMGVSGQWIDGLARDIAGLSASGAQGRFQINADQLGPIQVDIRQGDNGAAISLTVATEAAERALRQDSDRLRQDMALSSMRIIDVKIEREPHVAETARADTAQTTSQHQSGGQQGQNPGQAAGQGMGQSSAQSHMQGRGQPRENIPFGHKAGSDAAVLNHVDAGESTDGAVRARYA